MDLEKLYYEVKEIIDKVDFSKLYVKNILPKESIIEFKALKFALYDDTKCFFDGKYIEKDNSFLANTSILYNNEYIAIWNVIEDEDIEILASKMIHEMFHGYQNMNKDFEFANEFDSLFNYKYTKENLSIKFEESLLLANSILNTDSDYDSYQKIMYLRSYRKEHFPYEYEYENKVELIEGTANFIELMSLKQINLEKYQNKLNYMIKCIKNKCNYIPIRIISYDIGALLFCLKIKINQEIEKKNYNILNDIDYQSFDQIIINHNNVTKQIIDKAISENKIINEDYQNQVIKLTGVNCYDARYYDGYITSTFFVMYKKNNDEEIIKYGDFVIKIKNKENIEVEMIYQTKINEEEE